MPAPMIVGAFVAAAKPLELLEALGAALLLALEAAALADEEIAEREEEAAPPRDCRMIRELVQISQSRILWKQEWSKAKERKGTYSCSCTS
jgi:hypothetical protein